MKVLVINPGSTSTKIAIYEKETPVYTQSINHSIEDLAHFHHVLDQLDYRMNIIHDVLEDAGYHISELDAVSARGGFTKPVVAGTYVVDENVVDTMKHSPVHEHASNLGPLLAWELTKGTDVPAFFVDPVSVDELTDVARVTGFNGMNRRSMFHALNHRSTARKAAEMLGKTYDTCNFVVAHMGGGVTAVAHKQGRAVDLFNLYDEGCFAMDRGGALPVYQLIDYCFSGMSKEEVIKTISTKAGVYSYLGTKDFKSVVDRAFDDNDEAAMLIFKAMAYQLAKNIGSLAAVLEFDVDAIVLTGGMAYSERLVAEIKKYVEKIAPVMVLAGENELLSLAQGALRVLNGEEEARIY